MFHYHAIHSLLIACLIKNTMKCLVQQLHSFYKICVYNVQKSAYIHIKWKLC